MQSIFLNVENIPEFSHLNNTPVTILDVLSDVNNPAHINDTDPGSLPMFRIRFEKTGVENLVYPDEIPEAEWPATMTAVMAGMNAFQRNDESNPYDAVAQAELHQFFLQGIRLAGFKSTL